MDFFVDNLIIEPSTTGVPMKETIADITLAIVLGLTLAALALAYFDVLI
jgi:hypothetical protein